MRYKHNIRVKIINTNSNLMNEKLIFIRFE